MFFTQTLMYTVLFFILSRKHFSLEPDRNLLRFIVDAPLKGLTLKEKLLIQLVLPGVTKRFNCQNNYLVVAF